MPDHFHILITPQESLERVVQFIKGGFSFRRKREFAGDGEFWIAGLSDHRLRDYADFEIHQRYINQDPTKAGIVQQEHEYVFRSASGRFEADPCPHGLKPELVGANGAADARPFKAFPSEIEI